jgi:hypothetical protein
MMKWVILIWLGLGFAVHGQQLLPEPIDEAFKIDAKDLTVDYRVGFDDMLFSDQTNLASFRLTNESDKLVSGTLVVDVLIDGVRHWYALGSRKVEIGQGARSLVAFPMLMYSNDPSMRLRVLD